MPASPRHATPDPQRPDADLLLWAYSHAVFPMANPETGEIEWFCPDPRAVLPLDDRFHVPRNLARVVRQGRFEIRFDTVFERVMRACATPRDQGATWIDERLVAAYTQLHERGHAHSVEAWRDDRLVGGLYGVHIGAVFFGESMFVRPQRGGTNASKVCLVHLVERLRLHGFQLLDTQFANDHIEQFGCVEIPADEYEARLAEALVAGDRWHGADEAER